MIIYVENSVESVNKILELISEFIKVAGYKAMYKNQLYFYIWTISEIKNHLQ